MASYLKGEKPELPELDEEAVQRLDAQLEAEMVADFADALGMRENEPKEHEAYLRKILDTFSLHCPECGTICEEHGWDVRVRDHVIRHAAKLAKRFVEGAEIYSQQRAWGVNEPRELLGALFEILDELQVLNEASEPQDHQDHSFPEQEDKEGTEE
jgi:hypothetical protein